MYSSPCPCMWGCLRGPVKWCDYRCSQTNHLLHILDVLKECVRICVCVCVCITPWECLERGKKVLPLLRKTPTLPRKNMHLRIQHETKATAGRISELFTSLWKFQSMHWDIHSAIAQDRGGTQHLMIISCLCEAWKPVWTTFLGNTQEQWCFFVLFVLAYQRRSMDKLTRW